MRTLLSIEDPGSKSPKKDESQNQYLPDPGLVDAVNVALILRRPLLLTGEPGTGKTSFAAYVASKLKLGRELRFQTKSTSIARDLFYYYDSLGHFHATQIKKEGIPVDAAEYIKFHALGEAIIRAMDPAKVSEILPNVKEMLPDVELGTPRQSVVLIDEVDKAPRDFPNDILHEIQDNCFDIPEMGGKKFDAPDDPDLQPILIITSNSEKNLPDAFLRRCVYYNIPFPTEERLQEIVEAHHAKFVARNNPQLAAAIELFYRFRDPVAPIRKRPSTAELLGWLQAIAETSKVSFRGDSVQDLDKTVLQKASPVIIKTYEDLQPAEAIVNKWLLDRAKSMSATAATPSPIAQRE
jgi:MoxR-like ATPase